ncbi:hypothetical protein M406DRAFT_352242 [Cryphonectria parasitica EP155]|uniref:Rhodopsin domain-containing protein n=1 Tax=Cryphonectria parasitica (strain ATCC 38755 / EP155) TaxID=660469 RepID=A0A9P4XXP2_CRYP1|nr:uncharacterized protein M406DRAFT_352242 [Cryphonectria parasitica EP155]KAF3763194.1 hypothetical protein M406DRAFT_352242 [Cryphonectria parasitica EP155]
MSANEAEDYAEGNVETGVGAAMIALSIIVVGMRFYARTHFKAGLGWDDWLAMVALVGNVSAALLVLSASVIDPNSDWIEDNTDPNYHYTSANKTHLLLAWIASVIYFTCVSAAKLSILLLYKRIFSTSRAFQLQVNVLSAAIILFWIATTFATIFTCWPIKWSYISSLSPEPYCFNFNIYWFATGIIEAVFDICIILLPVKMVMKLQMSMKKRMSLVAVFSLGALWHGNYMFLSSGMLAHHTANLVQSCLDRIAPPIWKVYRNRLSSKLVAPSQTNSDTELIILPARPPTAHESDSSQWDIPRLTVWRDESDTGYGSDGRGKHGSSVNIHHSNSFH